MNRDLRLPPTAAMDPALIAQMLRRGACHVAALRAASAGMICGPTLDDRMAMLERAREELSQLEQADAVFAELTGGSLLDAAEASLVALPAPRSWLEATFARLVVCLSSRIELERADAATRVDMRALASEIEHVNAAHAALSELNVSPSMSIDLTSPFAAAWLDLALRALPDEAARARYLAALECEFGLTLPN